MRKRSALEEIRCQRLLGLMASAGLSTIVLAGSAFARDSWSGSSLPPAPRGEQLLNELKLYLELVVNGLPTGKIVPVLLRGGHYHVAAADLRRAGIPVEGEDAAMVAIDDITGLRVEYDAATLRLMIHVPTEWLPEQQIGSDHRYDYVPARSSPGLLINYDVYASDSDRGATSLSVWNELRVFGSFGIIATTGVFRTVSGAGDQDGFRRYDSYWRYSDEQRMLTYEAGDLLTRSLNWGSTVRLGGAQISRDFAIRPDIITYPLPQFAGEAAVPSTVDLFIDGYRADSAEIKPGPFTLTNIPSINGAGEAVVVVTDALGRQVSTTIPFYVSNALLRTGLSDFAMAGGFVRKNYGLKNFSYGSAAASASLRRGMTDWLTLELHGEAGRQFGLAGIGGVASLGNIGMISSSWSQSRHRGRRGDQWTIGYQYSARKFSIAALHSRRAEGFADLSVYDTKTSSLSRRGTSITGSVSLDRFGSIGAGYFDTRVRDGTRTRLTNLSWGLPLWKSASFYASGNHEIGTGKWSAALQLVMPLGRNRGTASSGYEHGAARGSSWRANYNRAVPSDGGIGWSLGYAEGSRTERYVHADLTWRNDLMQLRGGIYGGDGNYARWAGASGSIAMMEGSTFIANRINDAFAVVSTNGEPGVPVRYENQLIGRTDAGGHLLVPWASSYYRAKYSIDPLGLPSAVGTPIVEQRIAVRRGSGFLLEFPVSRVVAATVTLHDAAGQPLPVGAPVTVNGVPGTYVGWDGIAYMEGLQSRNALTITLPDGGSCAASFDLDRTDQIGRIGPLICQAENEP
ncbi:fimbria/pilus outer membrane usher protein [Sphingobium sp. CR28]|uniref:fimbria/pilus outer membrane usher protein n=1 Tax=Sphingobium sp. CR28 TaxID=3400272 RepID=UPI003FF003E5